MHDGMIECSAAFGKPAQPRGQFQPDFIQQDGTQIYTNLAPYRNSDLTVLVLQLSDSYVVFTPFSRMHLESPPMHYTETVTDSPSQKHGLLLGEQTSADPAILIQEGRYRHGRYSLRNPMLDPLFQLRHGLYRHYPEIIGVNRTRFNGCIAASALLGGLLGFASSLLYRRNKSIEQQLLRAVRKDKLFMAYQPIVDLPNGRIVGTEALVRWSNESGEAIGPEVFIKIAEQNGFVGEITKLVLRHVLREFGYTLRSYPAFRMCINVAASDLSDPEFLPMLDHSLYKAGVATSSLVIEITEGSTARHEIAIETIRSLRQRGHCVHIDDFGTGYSSLAYLHELSVDAIKIDKSFTQAIGTDSVVVAILPQILAMAEALDLKVIVEGVETPVQAELLCRLRPADPRPGLALWTPCLRKRFSKTAGCRRKKIMANHPCCLSGVQHFPGSNPARHCGSVRTSKRRAGLLLPSLRVYAEQKQPQDQRAFAQHTRGHHHVGEETGRQRRRQKELIRQTGDDQKRADDARHESRPENQSSQAGCNSIRRAPSKCRRQ